MAERKRKYPIAKNHRSQSNEAKTTNITFRLPKKLKRDFKLLCTIQETAISKMLRGFVEHSLRSKVTHF